MLGKSRLEALSDGVFSITMTLLVLKLDVPPAMHHMSSDDMLMQLASQGPEFATYVVTFLIAGGFWYLHHITFHFIRHTDSALVWINLLFLMTVSLLPFSAGLMSHLLVHPISQLFYFGNQVGISLLLAAHWIYARKKRLLDTSDGANLRRLTIRIGTAAAGFSACLAAGALLPMWSWVPFPIALAVGRAMELRDRRAPQ
jgi:uncharacterized membrane protein